METGKASPKQTVHTTTWTGRCSSGRRRRNRVLQRGREEEPIKREEGRGGEGGGEGKGEIELGVKQATLEIQG